jgi:hypothetical protein
MAVIEAIVGRDQAETVARDLSVTDWDARDDSAAFMFTRPFALTVIGNTIAFWNCEQLGIELQPRIDEVSLALVADSWSRTYRSRAVTFAGTASAVETRSGIRIYPDQVTTTWPAARLLPALEGQRPAEALEQTLQDIATRYGMHSADLSSPCSSNTQDKG